MKIGDTIVAGAHWVVALEEWLVGETLYDTEEEAKSATERTGEEASHTFTLAARLTVTVPITDALAEDPANLALYLESVAERAVPTVEESCPTE